LIRDFGHPHGGWGHRSIIPPSNKGAALWFFVVCKLQEAPLIRDFGHPHGGWGHRSIIPPK